MSRPNGKADGVTSAIGPKTLNYQHRHSASGDASRKASVTKHASAATFVCALHGLADGCLVGEWDGSQFVPCLRAVGDLLRQIGSA